MIINPIERDGAVLSGVSNVRNVTITANGKAFRVLSSTLYQDKPGAIVRELSSNAYDSHIANGTPDVPFVIHLPTAIEPYFSVKDFGIGMDDPTVEKVFTSLFESTKDNDANSIGAFGLGSKTPFSYTDSFTVVAIKDGVSRTYSLFMNANGCPSYVLLLEKETDEGNGVEVIVPVANIDDRQQFINSVKQQLHFFPVKPIIQNGTIHWDVEPDVPLIKQDQIVVYSQSNLPAARNSPAALMGPVGYDVNFDILSSKLPKFSALLQYFKNNVCRFYFKMGDVTVAPSRETLSYDDKTFEAFENILDGFIERVNADIMATIDNSSTEYEKAIALLGMENWAFFDNLAIGDLIEIRSEQDYYSSRMRFSARVTTNNLFKLLDANGFISVNALTKKSEIADVEDGKDYFVPNFSIFSDNLATMPSSCRSHFNIKKLAKPYQYKVVIDDMPVEASRKKTKSQLLAELNKRAHLDKCYTKHGFNAKTLPIAVCLYRIQTNSFNKLAAVVKKIFADAGFQVCLLSECVPDAVPKLEESTLVELVKAVCYEFDFSKVTEPYTINVAGRVEPYLWNKIKDKSQIPEKGFFITTHYSNFTYAGEDTGVGNIVSDFIKMKALGLIDEKYKDYKLFAFNQKASAKLNPDNGWLNIVDIMKDVYKKYDDKVDLYAQVHSLSIVLDEPWICNDTFAKLMDSFGCANVIKELAKVKQGVMQIIAETFAEKEFVNLFLKRKAYSESVRLVELLNRKLRTAFNEVSSMFPLISLSHYIHNPSSVFDDYINAMIKTYPERLVAPKMEGIIQELAAACPLLNGKCFECVIDTQPSDVVECVPAVEI